MSKSRSGRKGRQQPPTSVRVPESQPIRAWRVWSIGPKHERLAPRGTLYGPMTGDLVPWPGGVHTAVCAPPKRKPGWEEGFDTLPHEAPGRRCECGIRGDLSLTALLTYGEMASLATAAVRAGADVKKLDPQGWREIADRVDALGWRDWHEVVGEVELSGWCRPARKDDTRSTLRAERARVGGRVFFAGPTWDFAPLFERVHPWSTAVLVESLAEARNVPRASA